MTHGRAGIPRLAQGVYGTTLLGSPLQVIIESTFLYRSELSSKGWMPLWSSLKLSASWVVSRTKYAIPRKVASGDWQPRQGVGRLSDVIIFQTTDCLSSERFGAVNSDVKDCCEDESRGSFGIVVAVES